MNCSYHRLQQDLHWYAHQELRTFPECGAAASRYAAVDVRQGDFSGETYVNLCTGHEVKVRELPGFRWSRPKRVGSATT